MTQHCKCTTGHSAVLFKMVSFMPRPLHLTKRKTERICVGFYAGNPEHQEWPLGEAVSNVQWEKDRCVLTPFT